MQKTKRIQVFEHDKLTIGTAYGEDSAVFNQKHFDALVKFNQLHNDKYFIVGYKNIKFKHYVGVLQVDNLAIEVIPKADKTSNDKRVWQEALIEMLKTTQKLKVQKVGNANVSNQSIHLLDIYFEWYLNELQTLIRQGLIRKYYSKENNLNKLKGKLFFSKHISKNIVHKEKFLVQHQVYDYNHLIHQILFRALEIVKQVSKGNYLSTSIKKTIESFPDVDRANINANSFNRITINRKTKPYETAIAIARLIILNYAPNVTSGKEEMLALLFNMNDLWEEFILQKLRKAYSNTGFEVWGQESKKFWNGVSIRPDVVIKQGLDTRVIIDTKWKNIWQSKPSSNDLRQMYVYNDYWHSDEAYLLLPHTTSKKVIKESFVEKNHSCGLLWASILKDGVFNSGIGDDIKAVLELEQTLIST